MKVIGEWTNPIDPNTSMDLVKESVKRKNGTCEYCGFKMPITEVNPLAGLNVCLAHGGMTPEISNTVTLCAFCVKLNSLENIHNNGSPIGIFIEMPWLKQSDLINILRIIYCAQSSNLPEIKNTVSYIASTHLSQILLRIPAEWNRYHFDGTANSLIKALQKNKGYSDKKISDQSYYERLRLYISREQFEHAITLWQPIVEAQLLVREEA